MPKILVIDDKQDNLISLVALLRNLMPDCVVITALSGLEGIVKAVKEKPDAILLDIQMPGMDGFETCRRLKADETTRPIPVVMVTAVRTDAPSRIKGLEIGADAFLSKPIDEQELVCQLKVVFRIKAAEDALRVERDSLEILVRERTAGLTRLSTAIEQSLETIVITDTEGAIQYVNPAFERVTGYNVSEAMGQNPRILKSGKQDDAFYVELWKTISNGKTWIGRMVNKRKNDTFYTEDATISPVLDEAGRIVNYVAVKRDMTEHLDLTAQFEQAQKMESVGRLAGGVAHDFNNMLQAILGHTEMALAQVDPVSPIFSDLKEIHKAAERSANLTRQLLTFARKQTISPRIIDLNETVEGMLKMLRRLIGEDIDILWNPGRNLRPIKVDPSQIDQLLTNLCVNAQDAIEGVGTITIVTGTAIFDKTWCVDHTDFIPGEYISLAVSDTGCGMDREILSHLFEPFFTTKEVGKGTGLGLATVYGVVKQNNGLIQVQSVLGQGTTFKIYFPQQAPLATPLPVPAVIQPVESGSETILLVEDEAAILEMTKKMLVRLGYTVLSAASSDEAIRLTQEHAGRIDLIITDVVMPGMNGRNLVEKLRSFQPDLRCLFMSGYTSDVISCNGVLDEDVHFIQKPFSTQELATKVCEALR